VSGTRLMTSERPHIEVVVRLRPGADAGAVADRLAGFGLAVSPLAVGLLAAGDASAVRAAFATQDLSALEVPADLRDRVESAAVVPPKRFHR
jgi:hypothetical protein